MGDNETYLYRRQFLLGPKVVRYKNWKFFQLSDLHLSIHPDLNCIQATSGKKSITLLGYLLNPYLAEESNSAILSDFIATVNSKEQLIEKIYNYGGRWAIIYQDENDSIILHDPAAVRQIYYTTDSDLWCGSQPEIIAANTESKKNSNAYENLLAASAFEPWANPFWPGEESWYFNINRLLPNHYLDLVSRKVYRYWPNKEKKGISLQQGVDECSLLLKNLIKSAGNRFKLAHSITAGWDSRLLLAASKDLFSEITYYTYERPNLNRFSPDISIPKKLLKKYHRESIGIQIENNIDPVFSEIFRKNITLYHESVLLEAYALHNYKKKKGEEFVTINGNIGETGRCVYYNPEIEIEVTPEKLAAFVNMAASDYAIDQFSKWLNKTLPIASEFNYHILDLFYLEQKIGSWFGTLRSEYDITEEVFSPLNCRVLLDTILKVDPVKRIRKNPVLLIKIIKTLWPELLEFPVNPPDKVMLLKNFCKNIVRPFAEKTKLMPLLLDLKKR